MRCQSAVSIVGSLDGQRWKCFIVVLAKPISLSLERKSIAALWTASIDGVPTYDFQRSAGLSGHVHSHVSELLIKRNSVIPLI